MKAVGIHTYMGGMQLGAARVFSQVPGSMESWRDAYVAREAINLERLPMTWADSVDVVFANPPCSRFSGTAQNYFTAEDRSQLSKFSCLIECVDAARRCNVRVLWWETGPMAFKSGLDLAIEVQRALGFSTTWAIKIDAADCSIPQLRPRTHFVHFKEHIGPPDISAVQRPDTLLMDWLAARVSEGIPGGPTPKELKEWGCNDIESYVDVAQVVGTIKCWNPKQASPELSPVIMSRPIALGNRWMWIEEAAELMCLPPHKLPGMFWAKHLQLMSKGVCAEVAARVAAAIARAAGGRGGLWIYKHNTDDLEHRVLSS